MQEALSLLFLKQMWGWRGFGTLLHVLIVPFASSQSCSHAIYAKDGNVDFTKTLFNCSEQMTDPELIYSYKVTASGPVTVKTQISLNNLVSVSDLESTMVLDLYLVLSWVDPRWDIEEMWAGQKNAVKYQGLAIEQLVFATDERRLRLWLPDVTFTDEINEVVVSQTLKIMPGGLFVWARHFRLDIVQPHFTYENYPRDEQNLNIRFMSNAYSIDFMRLVYSDEPITFVNSAYPNLNDLNWELNNQWHLDADNFKAHVWEDDRTYSAGSVTVHTTYDSAILILDAERISDGILIRLGVPVLILMVLSGLVFWAATENRIDATMTILLAVSALYIVVFGNIPMLGYLTAFDIYIISMFFLLTCAVSIHQLNYRISEKADRRPLRYVIVRFLEFIGRVSIFPLAVILFVVMFPSDFVLKIRIPIIVILSLVCVITAVRDFGGVRKTFLNTMEYYAERRDKDEMHSMSEFELKFFLFYEKHLKRVVAKKSKSSDDDDDDNEDDEADFVPRMADPNARDGPTSIYVPNVRKKNKSVTALATSQGEEPTLPNLPEDSSCDSSGNNGAMEMSRIQKAADIDSVERTESTKKCGSVKRQKKQSIIDSIIQAEKERAAKRNTIPPPDDEVGYANPVFKK